MIKSLVLFISICGVSLSSCREQPEKVVTVPFRLDHNRMLVEGEMQKKDGTWRKVLFWVDPGNPSFILSKPLADDLRDEVISLRKEGNVDARNPVPVSVRIGGKLMDFRDVNPYILSEPFWLFSTMHIDANLPSVVLKRYQVVFDYPERQLSIGDSGSMIHRGIRNTALVHPETGIVQMDAIIDKGVFSFALDNGASYSFMTGAMVDSLIIRNPGWPAIAGTAGCANMWGWWPPEIQPFLVLRIPEVKWGNTDLTQVGIVGVPDSSLGGISMGAWYSRKTVKPVDGFLGANALKSFRVEIDYPDNAVYFEKGTDKEGFDMDIVGLAVSPQRDSSYLVIGITQKNHKPLVEGIIPGDKLIQIDRLTVKGATMGSVVDALRGKPGEVRKLLIERGGKQIKVDVRVERIL